jgi:hypothetical protein
LAASAICFIIIRRSLIQSKHRERTEIQVSSTTTATNASTSSTSTSSLTKQRKFWPRILSILRSIRLLIQFVIIGFAAFVYPSIMNSVYFIFFLSIAFLWSLSIKFGRKYALIRALLVVYTGLHLLTFYLYQFGFFQEALPPLSLFSK